MSSGTDVDLDTSTIENYTIKTSTIQDSNTLNVDLHTGEVNNYNIVASTMDDTEITNSSFETGTIDQSTITNSTIDSTTVKNTFVPFDASVDLGSNDSRFNDAYIANELNLGLAVMRINEDGAY